MTFVKLAKPLDVSVKEAHGAVGQGSLRNGNKVPHYASDTFGVL